MCDWQRPADMSGYYCLPCWNARQLAADTGNPMPQHDCLGSVQINQHSVLCACFCQEDS